MRLKVCQTQKKYIKLLTLFDPLLKINYYKCALEKIYNMISKLCDFTSSNFFVLVHV